MGRRKIEVRKIEDKNKCVATFRKRRDGLFKKALELHHLTGAEIMLTLVYNKSKYCFNSHGNVDQSNKLVNTFHYTKQFQFKACGSHLSQGCNEINCSSKLNNHKKNDNINHYNDTPSLGINLKSDYSCSNGNKLNYLPMIESFSYTNYKSKRMKLTNEERMANIRYLIVDELFKRALLRFRTLSKVSNVNKKESLISPVYNSWTMLSPSSIIPSRRISSHVINSSEKSFYENNSSTDCTIETHTDSLLFQPNQSLHIVYPNDFSYSSNTDQLHKELNSSPTLSQILEFIDENINNTNSNNNNNNNIILDDTDNTNSKNYFDLDENQHFTVILN
ncbi:unnamed protein product [Heterobilharzia americana]|nr:unnamed protein product [Heterobilharzia americana]